VPHKSLFALAPLLLALFPAAAEAQQVNAGASYIVTLGGINIAAVDVALTETGGRYALDLNATVAGMGSLIASGSASAASSGIASGQSLTSQEFDLRTEAQGEVFSVDISYSAGDVAAFQVNPPIEGYDRVPLERSHLTGVNDMLAAFLVKASGLTQEVCNRQLRIFTGIERFNVDMAFARAEEATSPRTGYQGPVVLCTLDYQPISGHFASSEITDYLAASNRILIWYAPLGDSGYFIPYRALVGTTAGDLSMVLTALRY